MNEVITIPSRSGSMVVDFAQKKIFLNREGVLAKTAGLVSMPIEFGDITDIELRYPSFTTLGGCNIILKNIRYTTTGGFDMTSFGVDKNSFSLLESTLKNVLGECNLSSFKDVNSVIAEKVVYTAPETNYTMSNQAQNTFNQKKKEVENDNVDINVITEAKLFAQSVELQLLKAPASAKFRSLEEMTVTELNGIYIVKGYVDSQNSYGAMIRTPFVLKVYKDEAGWKSADTFQSTQASINKQVASNMLLYWIIGLIGSAITFAIMYAFVSSMF